MSGAFTPSLVAIFAFWAAACIGLAWIFGKKRDKELVEEEV